MRFVKLLISLYLRDAYNSERLAFSAQLEKENTRRTKRSRKYILISFFFTSYYIFCGVNMQR